MVKKIVMSVLILSLFISSNVWASSASDLPDPYAEKDIPSLEAEIPLEVRQAMENQIDALYSYQKLYDSFGKDDVGLPIYPDEYAGAYIEDGNLIIQLTDNSTAMRNKYLQICETDLKIDFKDQLVGPSALAYSEDQIAPIKILSDFAKDHPALVLKVGIVDGEKADQAKLAEYATLPSRDGLLTMLAGGMIGLVKDLSICLDLYSQQKEEN